MVSSMVIVAWFFLALSDSVQRFMYGSGASRDS